MVFALSFSQVLSDPTRRRTYDRFGANGVKWIEDPATIDPQVKHLFGALRLLWLKLRHLSLPSQSCYFCTLPHSFASTIFK
jgi:curved DNA-binding protein CbpA